MARRNFNERITLDAALAWIDAAPARGTVEDVALPAALGRVLAEPVTLGVDRPPLDLAFIDGYALQAEATLGATAYNPLSLPLAPSSEAVSAPFAVACCAGAPLPPGADAVLPLDAVEASAGLVEVGEPAPRGAGVARRGEMARRGEITLPAGRWLGPMQIALAASAGAKIVKVARRPVVEFRLAGAKPPGVDALAIALSALVARDGGIAHCGDGGALGGDGEALVMVGRSGWGDDDNSIPRLLTEGGKLDHHGVAFAPGGSIGFGWLGSRPVILIPGDPYAALATYEVFIGRLVRRLAGRPASFARSVRRCRLVGKIASPVGVAEFAPVTIDGDSATLVAIAPSDGLVGLARADGFVLVPTGLEGFAEGAEVEVVELNCGGAT
jgi:molybdopterin molybdotransferase